MTVETIDVSPTLRVRIEIDEDPINPRKEYDNLGTIVYWSGSRHMLGDKGLSRDDLDEVKAQIDKGSLIGLPVWTYIHSGVVMKAAETNPFSCPWDSGCSGFVYMTPADALKEWGKVRVTGGVRKAALQYLKGEVETFSQYLAGECYGYVIERLELDDDGEVSEVTELESCWGFLGDVSYVCQEALAAAQFHKEPVAA